MALPVEPNDSFIREVDEEYRRDQLNSLWARYGRWLVLAVVLLLAALGGYLWWRAEQARTAGERGEQFARALTKLETGNVPDAAPILGELAKGDDGYATLSKLTQAANALQAGDNRKALGLYNAVANDAKQPQPYRELALIKATRLEFDTLPPATVIARLKALSVPGNPWFGVAGEMTAIARMRAGQPELAGPLLGSIAEDRTLPPTLRGRAGQLAGSLGVVVKPDPANPAPAPSQAPSPQETK